MSETVPKLALQPEADTAIAQTGVSIGQIFLEFLIIGATSFGGVVPYVRGSLVTKRHWVEDKEFVEMLSMSQSLPGLNAIDEMHLAFAPVLLAEGEHLFSGMNCTNVAQRWDEVALPRPSSRPQSHYLRTIRGDTRRPSLR